MLFEPTFWIRQRRDWDIQKESEVPNKYISARHDQTQLHIRVEILLHDEKRYTHEMLKRKHNDAESYYNRGNASYKKREYDKAIADFSEIIEREPDHAEAYYNRGNAYRGEVDFDQGVNDCV